MQRNTNLLLIYTSTMYLCIVMTLYLMLENFLYRADHPNVTIIREFK